MWNIYNILTDSALLSSLPSSGNVLPEKVSNNKDLVNSHFDIDNRARYLAFVDNNNQGVGPGALENSASISH